MSKLTSYSSLTYPIEKEFREKYTKFHDSCLEIQLTLSKLKLLKEFAGQKTDRVDKYIKLKKGFEEAETIEDKKKVIQLYNKITPTNIIVEFVNFVYFDKIKNSDQYNNLIQFFFPKLTVEADNSYRKYITKNYVRLETLHNFYIILDRTYNWITTESRISYFPETQTTVIKTLNQYLISDLADIILNYA